MTRTCDHCRRPGKRYEYRGIKFDGLSPNRGELLCAACLVASAESDGVNVRVQTWSGDVGMTTNTRDMSGKVTPFVRGRYGS